MKKCMDADDLRRRLKNYRSGAGCCLDHYRLTGACVGCIRT